MVYGAISFFAMMIASLLLDAAVRPRLGRVRHPYGLALHLLTMTAIFGLFLTESGNAPLAALLGIAMMALFMAASNAKFAMLGEPLVFSDLALIVFVVRHPRFYFTAISARQKWGAGFATLLAAAALVALFEASATAHLAGLGLMFASTIAIAVLLSDRWSEWAAPVPNLEGDLARYGLTATLLLYWRRWRATSDPAPSPGLAALRPDGTPPHLIVIVQCESFADPVELTCDATQALPGLAQARATAWQSGVVEVSGFGAYTMRTEYGVLFGREEAVLGFRRYDPFLTALGETSYALPARLRGLGYRSLFVHPHDMRFYSRDRLMPAMGFERLIGLEGFPPVPADARYVDDRTLGDMVSGLAEQAGEPTLIYAVTMENHGPWDGDETGRLDAYLRHASSSDAMLTGLIERLSENRKPALLVFFGDHRPSIPGVTDPSGPRHTPYVMLRFDADGRPIPRGEQVDLTPARLHHAILECLRADA